MEMMYEERKVQVLELRALSATIVDGEEQKTVSRGKLKEIKPPKIRACITSDCLTWDAEGMLARTFGFWAAHAKFYVDIPPQLQDLFENRYFSLFGKLPEPQIGLYNLSLDVQKWAMEAEITFPVGYPLPNDIAIQQTAREGKIARIQLFWALMEHGFELTESQNPDRIRAFVPESQRQYFDARLKGEIQ